MSNNTITLIGNLTKEPELRFTSAGQPVANFRMAANERFQRNGEWTDRVTYMNVTAWGTLAENLAQSLSKGDRVLVTGRFQTREFSPEDGETKYFVELVASEVAVTLRWAVVDGITKSVSKELVSVGHVADDEEPF